ncbi:MAG: histidine triad nucleotide-binding protein [Gemmatimonadota bacterium]
MGGSTSCIFCRIASGEIPVRLVHEDDQLVAFHDLNPQAPAHVLVIPRRHVESLGSLVKDDAELAGRLLITAAEIARSLKVDETGYRVVANVGEDGGQSVAHLHLHLLGGRAMVWPPG